VLSKARHAIEVVDGEQLKKIARFDDDDLNMLAACLALGGADRESARLGKRKVLHRVERQHNGALRRIEESLDQRWKSLR
jgi:hypothetical protein